LPAVGDLSQRRHTVGAEAPEPNSRAARCGRSGYGRLAGQAACADHGALWAPSAIPHQTADLGISYLDVMSAIVFSHSSDEFAPCSKDQHDGRLSRRQHAGSAQDPYTTLADVNDIDFLWKAPVKD